MDHTKKKSRLKLVGLVWILIECSLVSGNIFGFASLFSVLPRYGIYESRCRVVLNETKDCSAQTGEYQLAFTLGIGFFNLPAVLVGMINDFFGARVLKLIAIVLHLISWLSLGFVAPGRDWLLFFHTIFLSLSGICTLLSSFSISAHFVKRRGLVTSLISGAQLSGSVWFAIFQILIDKQLVSLSNLAFTWASLSLLMLGSAMLFLDWRFTPLPSKLKLKSKSISKGEVKTITSEDTLTRHLSNPLFIVVTLFLSCLLFTISFLPIVWFPWIYHLSGKDNVLTNRYTFWYNMIGAFGIIVAPTSGLIIDYKSYLGYTQRMLNIFVLQTITWLISIVLCVVCMFQSMTAATAALVIVLFSRPILVAGSQALIVTAFPPQFIGSLLGVMWTIAGIISFATYGLVLLTTNPAHIWRAWLLILILCFVMGGHLIQVWRLYYKSKKAEKNLQPSINEEELKTLNDN